MIFVDTNMWCYYFDQRLPEHKYVREPLRDVIKSEEIASNTVVVMEIAHYLVRHFAEGEARKKIETFVNLRNMRIVDFNHALVNEALEILMKYAYTEGLGGRDATIIATLKSLSLRKILSHDDIFKRLAIQLGLEIVDPIPETI